MTEEEKELKDKEQFAVNETNKIAKQIKKEVIKDFLNFVDDNYFAPLDRDVLDQHLEDYIK